MKNIIVGTAGHVDHGKTCLIKALTGTDTDRLKEEKKRGITIELGFANLENNSNLRIGIIDVPGHEKFVRNMLAGIGGIDLILFVVGLDEGVMPQTVEHFEIIKSIGIKKGFIVYTKADISDPETVPLIEEDVKNLVKGSFLEDAERIKVSAYTGENIDYLKKRILEEALKLGTRREAKELFRLPIDRVFSMEGFGTVVTGTLTEGSINAGDEVEIYPLGKKVKIRQIQNHNELQTSAVAGQRTALNLTNITKEELERGEVLAYPGSIVPGLRANVRLELFKSTKRKLKNGDRIHVNYGSNQTQCRVFHIEGDYWQLIFDSPVPLKRNDRIIIRFLSPVETFGGGIVLQTDASKCRNNDAAKHELCNIMEKLDGCNSETAVSVQILFNGRKTQNCMKLSIQLNLSLDETQTILTKLYKEGSLIRLSSKGEEKSYSYISKEVFKEIIADAERILDDFHAANPLSKGMVKDQLRQSLAVDETILDGLIQRQKVLESEGFIMKPGFSTNYSNADMDMKSKIEKAYLDAGIAVPDTQTLISTFEDSQKARQIINNLQKEGLLIKMSNSAYIHTKCFDVAFEKMKEHYRHHKEMTLAQFRDMTQTSRKYSLQFLEFCDYRGYTKMQGEARIAYQIKL